MDVLFLMNFLMGIVLALIALPLYFEKIPRNGLYGFRVRKTMENDSIWYQVNKYSSLWLIASGLSLSLFSAGLFFVPGLTVDAYSLICLAVFSCIFAIGMIFSIRYMNSL